jgi:CRISPR-associated endonuclease/helicase Cas3
LDEGDTSYAVQNATRDAPAPDDGSLVVLESPTGSGKTEGVLARYARLLELGQVDSLFFAVPTRAAAKQLWRRVCEATKRIFGSDELRPHLAVPGYLRAGDATGTFVGRSVRWDEPIGPAGWAAESSKRYTSSPIAVGTTDQVLLSGLKNRHAHLRSAGLARSLLVIDEVHASSTYMHETLRNIIDLHLSAGGHTVLMSATLGTSVRTDYTGETEKPFGKACEESYPRVTTRTSEGVHSSDPLPSPGRPKQIRIAEEAICGDPQAVADHAAAAARDGARVLVIRNTVSACRQTFNCLPQDVSFELAGVPCPHHSRFTSEDRRALDEKIERYYGKTPEREVSPGLVTIATQTVEQSLDIDADLLITDLCPMDVLLQRIGRLHRHVHDYPRPDGYDVPCCVVLAPPHSIGSYINTNKGAFFSPIPGAGTVYNEIAVLKATRDALTSRPMIEIPKENRLLVEKSLHPERLDDIRSRDPYTAIAGQSAQQHRRERLIARENILDWDRSYVEQPFPSERLATRLGLMTITADLPKPVETPFGNRSEAVPISPYQLSEEELETLPEQPEAHDVQPIQNGFTFKLVGKQFRYDHCGVAADC